MKTLYYSGGKLKNKISMHYSPKWLFQQKYFCHDLILFFISSFFSVNGAFHHLRGLIPTEPVDRKLSKIETLRLATSYIEHLVNQLNSGMYLLSFLELRQYLVYTAGSVFA